MKELLAFYGDVDGLPPGSCSLHAHSKGVVEDNRLTSPSVFWKPYSEEKLRTYSSKTAPTVALLGGRCQNHPLLPNAKHHSFTNNKLMSPQQQKHIHHVSSSPHASLSSFTNEHNAKWYECVATHCAGIIGARPNTAASGIAPNCNLLCLQVIDDNGFGTVASMVKAVQFAINEKVQIICIPLSIKFKEDNATHQEFRLLLSEAAKNDILIIAAKNSNETCFPADEPYVCSVVGFNKKHELADPSIYYADIGAPAESIWSIHEAESENNEELLFCRLSGTPMATCIIAGIAARLISSDLKNIIHSFYEYLKAGIFNCVIHSYPLKVSHLLEESSYLLMKGESSKIKKNGEYFVSPNKEDEEDEDENSEETGVNEFQVQKDEKKEEEEKKIENDVNNDIKVITIENADEPKKLTTSSELNINFSPPNASSLEDEGNYRQFQKKLYEQIIECVQKREHDPFVMIRMRQHSTLEDTKDPVLQKHQIPTNNFLSKKNYSCYQNGPKFGFIDWLLYYNNPFSIHTRDIDGKMSRLTGNLSADESSCREISITPETINLLISKRISDKQLNVYLWEALQECNGKSISDWCFAHDGHAPDNLKNILKRRKFSQGSSEIKSTKVHLKPSVHIPNIWEFCNRLSSRDGIIDAEPLFLESEYFLRPLDDTSDLESKLDEKVKGGKYSMLLSSSDPNYALVSYLGIEPSFDLSEIGDDVNIAVIGTHLQKHECLFRANINYENGWDYVRNEAWRSLPDTWKLGTNEESDIPNGSQGLANISAILGVSNVSSGISPNSSITPIRAFYETYTILKGDKENEPRVLSSVHKSTTRLVEAITHARKNKADVISIHFGVVSGSFIGSLQRVVSAAEKDNIIVCASIGEFVKFSSSKSKNLFLFPPGGSAYCPARLAESIGVASCSANDKPWTCSCCGNYI